MQLRQEDLVNKDKIVQEQASLLAKPWKPTKPAPYNKAEKEAEVRRKVQEMQRIRNSQKKVNVLHQHDHIHTVLSIPCPPHHTLTYHTLIYHTITPYHTKPHHTISYLNSLLLTIAYLTIPHHILPYCSVDVFARKKRQHQHLRQRNLSEIRKNFTKLSIYSLHEIQMSCR